MESFIMADNTSWFLCDIEHDILCVLLYTLLISMTGLTVGGNLLVIISIIYFKELHTPTNYLILSLAVSDVLIGALIFPFNMGFSPTQCLYQKSLLCFIRSIFDVIISISSVLNMCCISIDRYYAVCHPLIYKTKITDSVAVIMGLGSWAVAILIGVVFSIYWFFFDICNTDCVIVHNIIFVFAYYLPAMTLLCIYCKILRVALKQARSIQNTANQSSKSEAVASKERKATKTISIVMGLFLICWAPFFICYPLQPLSTTAVNLIEPFNWFAISNSMFNPFIYAFFYRWFRSAFRYVISLKIFQDDVSNTKLY